MEEQFYHQNLEKEERAYHFHRVITSMNGSLTFKVNTVTYIQDGEENKLRWRFQRRKTTQYTSEIIEEWKKKTHLQQLPSDANKRSEVISKIEKRLGIGFVETNLSFVC